MIDTCGWQWLPKRGVYVASQPPDVRIPDYLLKCVGFVAEAMPDMGGVMYDHAATGFFATVPSDDPNIGAKAKYFVFITAAHVAKAFEGRAPALVVNRRGGGVMAIGEVAQHWCLHPTDPHADVAVLPFNWVPEMDIMAIPIGLFASKPLHVGDPVGLGDEVFMPGLFTYVVGESRNMPIVRYGTVAMLPDEPINVDGHFTDAYLIEARSIGGMSGSPVFIRPTTSIPIEGNDYGLHGIAGLNLVLGLMHGHWDIRPLEMNNSRPAPSRAASSVNMGIGVVVPAHKIVETINHPELIRLRKEADDKRQSEMAPTPDQDQGA